jgi:uncharacterized protein involved in outer membrane biogenesis
MTEEAQRKQRRRSKIWMIPAALAVIVAAIVVPPLVSISRYQNRITHAISASLGRPVRLSSAELRLFPRPGFVLTDLTVDEDPSCGFEPMLHANTVQAAIRLLPLWRGRLEISRISVDEASLNLVRTPEGRWNLDSLFRSAAGSQSGGAEQRRSAGLPYLEATNSRVNIKKGFEKLPYSLIDADLSFWQENSGDWRVRLRGQPARTDVNLDLGDTGIVRLEARLQRAPELREMPMHLDVEWREAQLGQLSRLVIGSDPGWRGDLTGELHLDGTADAAKVTTRLRAIGVHRAEFAPAAPLDFDANCNFIYHYSRRSVERLGCDSPLGDGHLRMQGDFPGDGQPTLSLELQQIPTQAALDALRTVRNRFGAGLDASGTINGKLTYDASATPATPVVVHGRPSRTPGAKEKTVVPGPLSGTITVDRLRLSGDSLSQPLQIPKIVFEPSSASGEQGESLISTISLPAGAPTPIVVNLHVASSGYDLTVRGPGAIGRVRELARAAGLPESDALNSIAGDPVTLDLVIAGPWLPAPEELLSAAAPAGDAISSAAEQAHADQAHSDRLSGTVTLHNANWKSDSLATAVQISQGTLHLDGGQDLLWDPVAFSYGPLKGTATLQIPAPCEAPAQCRPRFDLKFATLDSAELQATLLGTRKSSSLLSSVIARLTPSSVTPWPTFDSSISADSFIAGPVTLRNVIAELRVQPTGADFSSLDADLLGGKVHATGSLTNGVKPAYSIEAQFEKLSPAAVCQLLGLQCKGDSVEGNGKIDLAGFTGADLAASAIGKLQFDWHRGSAAGRAGSLSEPPPVLARFDRWTGEVDIANGALKIQQDTVQHGSHTASAGGAVTLANPPKISFAPSKPASVSKR